VDVGVDQTRDGGGPVRVDDDVAGRNVAGRGTPTVSIVASWVMMVSPAEERRAPIAGHDGADVGDAKRMPAPLPLLFGATRLPEPPVQCLNFFPEPHGRPRCGRPCPSGRIVGVAATAEATLAPRCGPWWRPRPTIAKSSSPVAG